MDQARDRLHSRDARGDEDGGDDEEPGDALGPLSASDRAAIFGGTANAFYGLGI